MCKDTRCRGILCKPSSGSPSSSGTVQYKASHCCSNTILLIFHWSMGPLMQPLACDYLLEGVVSSLAVLSSFSSSVPPPCPCCLCLSIAHSLLVPSFCLLPCLPTAPLLLFLPCSSVQLGLCKLLYRACLLYSILELHHHIMG